MEIGIPANNNVSITSNGKSRIATFVLPLEAFTNGLTLFLVFFVACDPVFVVFGLTMFLNSAFLDCKGFVDTLCTAAGH